MKSIFYLLILSSTLLLTGCGGKGEPSKYVNKDKPIPQKSDK